MLNKVIILLRFIGTLSIIVTIQNVAVAKPPLQEEVDVYSSLCKIGQASKVEVDAKLSGKLGFFGRKLLSGEGKVSKEEIIKEFPDIKNESNRLLALQSYQDCLFRYVEAFHLKNSNETKEDSTLVFSPKVNKERKREIVFLVNELESFKKTMNRILISLPNKVYDTRNAKEKYPKKDTRIMDIDNYSKYKAFQTIEGIPNFSNLSNNDISILCDTFKNEVRSYNGFKRDYRGILDLVSYSLSREANRICSSALRGR